MDIAILISLYAGATIYVLLIRRFINLRELSFNEREMALNSAARELNFRQEEVIKKLAEFNNAIAYNKQMLAANNNILSDNQKVLKKIDVKVYSMKESLVTVYDYFKAIHDFAIILPESKQAYVLLSGCDHNMRIIENNFINQFGVSPEEYKKQKTNITGNNGYLTDYSIN